jgi:hypothetical protein
MEVGLEILVDQITARIDAMAKRANTLPQFFERNLKRRYLDAQKSRFMLENSGEFVDGGTWDRLSPAYAAAKPHRFKSYPGGGTKLLIATNKLVDSVLAKSTDYRQVTGDRSFIVSTTVPYAGFVDDKRTITRFNSKFYIGINQDLIAYVKEGKT